MTEEQMGINEPVKKKKRGIFKWIVLFCVLLLLAIGIYIGNAYFKVKNTADHIQHKIEGREKSDLRKSAVSLSDQDPISVALFGVDANKSRLASGDAGRSDSIIIMSMNPKTKKTIMVSIPRDTQATMVGKDSVEKINHAYAYGGPGMAVKSVEKLMNVPIDFYATVNMDGLHDMIDKVGGIDVVSNATFSYSGYDFVKGETTHLDGEKALAFVRSRKENGAGGDFGRQQRQQIAIQGLAKKILSVGSITKMDSLLKGVEDNVVTDFSFDDLKTLGLKYRNAQDKVTKYQLQGTGSILDDGLWYFLPDEQQKAEITKAYRDNLDLKE